MITIYHKLYELIQDRAHLAENSNSHNTIGFVPTMGNLHEGHLSLIREALQEHHHVYISIFVNPKQFGPHEDFARYPRTLKNDLEKIKLTLESCSDFPSKNIYVFAPDEVEEIFPHDFSTSISVGKLSQEFCGKFRPGHFDGVATVLYRLFTLISPDVAYFGLKDYQQTVVIKRMVEDLILPVLIKTLSTVRDENGLALSSRNQYLGEEGIKKALHLYQTLNKIKSIINDNPWEQVKSNVNQFISETLKDSQWDYLEVCEQKNLTPPQNEDHQLVILGAYRVGQTRLIDNLLITTKS